jgi:hypothetical protein
MVAGDWMNRAALLKKSDAVKLAETAKLTGCPIEVEVRGVKIRFVPEHASEIIDEGKVIVL